MIYMVIQEIENEKFLDDGDIKLECKLYYWELIVCFVYYMKVIWNLGEENGFVFWIFNG